MTKPEIKALVSRMADAAEAMGADPDDGNGAVRALVTANGLGFDAWFCVCCEIADRAARKEGYKSSADRAASIAFGKR